MPLAELGPIGDSRRYGGFPQGELVLCGESSRVPIGESSWLHRGEHSSVSSGGQHAPHR